MTNEAQTHRPGMSLEDKLFDMLGAYTIIRNGIELFPNPEGITDKYIPDEIRAEIHREVVDRILRLAQIEESERGGKILFNDLAQRLIRHILEFNSEEHDIELNLLGIIAKAKEYEAQRAKNERGEEDTIRLDWLDKHCSFVADEPYRIGPYKVGELRKMADDGLETDRKLGNCICMDCGEVIKTTEQSKHDKICSLKESMKPNLKERKNND